MIVNLADAKQHLRIDSEDDDTYISVLIGAAEELVKNATGKTFDDSNPLAKTACLLIVADLYENRGITTDKVGEKTRSIVDMILAQLSLSYGGEVN